MPLSLIEPQKGMFRQFTNPLRNLCAYEPIRGSPTLMGLVSEAVRRLRQLDRFHDEAWHYIHRTIAVQPSREEFLADSTSAEEQKRCGEYAYDAAEVFYMYSQRVLDIIPTKEMTDPCGGAPNES